MRVLLPGDTKIVEYFYVISHAPISKGIFRDYKKICPSSDFQGIVGEYHLIVNH